MTKKADIAYVMSAFTAVESNTADVVLDSRMKDYLTRFLAGVEW